MYPEAWVFECAFESRPRMDPTTWGWAPRDPSCVSRRSVEADRQFGRAAAPALHPCSRPGMPCTI